MRTIVFLTISNIFMTIAWYGHLKYKSWPLFLAILVSWGIAFLEYCFQVPANRAGYYEEFGSLAKIKTIQEVITLIVFCAFSLLVMKENLLKWNYLAAAFCLVAAVFFVFKKW